MISSWQWPHRPVETFAVQADRDGRVRSIAQDYEASESKADKALDRHFFFWIAIGSLTYLGFFVLGVVKLLEIFGWSL